MTTEQTVLVEKRDHVYLVTLNRPERLNAFDQATMVNMYTTFESIADDPQCRALVLTGAGGNFSAGGDVRGLGLGESMAKQPTITLMENMRRFQHRLQMSIANLPMPTIAAIEGVAISGGLDLALCCDMRISAAGARICENYSRLGLVPGNGGCFLLSAIIGPAKAAELVFTGKTINGKDALALGLVTHLADDGGALAAALTLAEAIAANAPIAVRFAKELLMSEHRAKLQTHLQQVGPLVSMLQQTADHAEGALAIREKRKPRFTGV